VAIRSSPGRLLRLRWGGEIGLEEEIMGSFPHGVTFNLEATRSQGRRRPVEPGEADMWKRGISQPDCQRGREKAALNLSDKKPRGGMQTPNLGTGVWGFGWDDGARVERRGLFEGLS